jgi:isopenicillin N synthase-like dioxygenase
MIPQFDLRDFEEDKQGFAREFGKAFHDFGFIRLKGHGIPQATLETADRESFNFFEQPDAVKSRHWVRGQEGIMSYTKNFEVARGASAVDLKEEWCIRTRLPAGHPLAAKVDQLLTVPEFPGFKSAVTGLFNAFEKATVSLMKPLSLYMGLDEGWFDDKCTRSHSTMRLLHYPTAGTAASHLDLNFMTWLRADTPGLYVTARDGTEHAVTAQKDELILNGGMMLGLLTNDDLKPSWHRVAAEQPRNTIVFFVHPDPDFMLSPLPAFHAHPPVIRPDYFPTDGKPISVENFVQQEVKKIFTGEQKKIRAPL